MPLQARDHMPTGSIDASRRLQSAGLSHSIGGYHMPILITVSHDPEIPDVYEMIALYQRFHTVKAFGKGVIPDDVGIEKDGELLLTHTTLKQTLVLPTIESLAALWDNKMQVSGLSSNLMGTVSEVSESGHLGWATIHNIADYPRDIKAFLKHCLDMDF
jgi:hypothetical protein